MDARVQTEGDRLMVFPIEAPALEELGAELRRVVEEHKAEARGQDAPFLLHMLGVPGVGKTSLIAPLREALAGHAPLLVGFDQIMARLPSYQAMETVDPVRAFAEHEQPARAAGYRLLAEVLALRASVIFDNGGAAALHRDLLRYARQCGYRIVMVHVVAGNDVAARRLLARQAREGRYTPPDYIPGRATLIDGFMEEYRALADDWHTVVNADRPEANRRHFLDREAARIAASLNPPE